MTQNRRRIIDSILLAATAAFANWIAQPNEILLNGSPVAGILSASPLILMFLRYAGGYQYISPGISAGKIRPTLPLPVDNFSSIISLTPAALTYAVISTLTSYFWLKNFGDFSVWTLGGVLFVYLCFYPIYFRLMGAALSLVNRRYGVHPAGIFLKAVVIASGMLAYEFFKSRGYLAFPWNLAAFPFHRILSISQIAELTGVWGISMAALWFQTSLVIWLLERVSRPRKFAPSIGMLVSSVAIIFLLMIYGQIRITTINGILNHQLSVQPSEQAADASNEAQQTIDAQQTNDVPVVDTLLAVLVQQNADSWDPASATAAVEQAIQLSQAAISESQEVYGRKPDIVTWSETSLARPYNPMSSYYTVFPRSLPLRDYLDTAGVPLLTGAPIIESYDPFIAMNSVLTIDPDGSILGSYSKIQLIPFAEHVPLSGVAAFASLVERLVGISAVGWTRGDGYYTMPLGNSGLLAGTPICFEDSFANVTRHFVLEGADVIINLTNNSWSKTRSAQMQHFISARYRAIENRRPLLRSTNSGVTAVVMPDGSIRNRVPDFEATYLIDEVPVIRNAGVTLYTLLGDWFAWLAILTFLGITLRAWYSLKKG